MRERRKKRKVRVTITRRILTFLCIYFVLFTANYSMSTFSRYQTDGSNDASVGVAKWDVSVNQVSASNTLNIVSGDSVAQSYKIRVESDSDVTVSYNIILSNIPDEMMVSLDGGTYQTPVNNEITFTNVGIFNVTDEIREKENILYFKAPIDSDIPNTNEIDIDVKLVQVI